jgi:hypothetical protein
VILWPSASLITRGPRPWRLVRLRWETGSRDDAPALDHQDLLAPGSGERADYPTGVLVQFVGHQAPAAPGPSRVAVLHRHGVENRLAARGSCKRRSEDPSTPRDRT